MQRRDQRPPAVASEEIGATAKHLRAMDLGARVVQRRVEPDGQDGRFPAPQAETANETMRDSRVAASSASKAAAGRTNGGMG